MKWIEETPIRIRRERFKVYVNMVVEKFRYLPNILIHIPKLNKKLIESISSLKYFYLANFLLYTGSLMFFSQFPVYLSYRGFDSFYIYLLSVFNSGVAACMYTRAGTITQNLGAIKTFTKALLLRVVSITMFISALFINSYAFIIPAAISLASIGYTWAYISVSATLMISKAAKENNRGSMMGGYNLIASLGSMSGSFIGGVLVSKLGFLFDFIFSIVVVLGSITALYNTNIASLLSTVLRKYVADIGRSICGLKR